MNVPALADGVAENVQNHWRYNNIKAFSSQRPYLRDTRESETVLSWMEKTILTSEPSGAGEVSRADEKISRRRAAWSTESKRGGGHPLRANRPNQ